MQKPKIPKGTRDFGPEIMVKRNLIFETIRSVFQKYGFLPLETPAMENLSVLTGKYGDEGDQLLYKILNSGDFMNKVQPDEVQEGYKRLTPKIAEKGLRYDLTVPFARYVVMNQHEINFPFKRYQIQPVWRADRPQKGRYREFYQCDADVVGTDSLVCEMEITGMIQEVFKRLRISDFTIKINNRKILAGITESIDARGKETAFCVAIDKLDKIGKTQVVEELKSKGFSDLSIEKLDPVFTISGTNQEKLNQLKSILGPSEEGMKGIAELEKVFSLIKLGEIPDQNLEFDITLARGLTYYTGAIFEVKANKVTIGSVGGGGRYDNLTGVFGLTGISGVGFSFGVDRIYDVMETLGLFEQQVQSYTKLLIAHFDQETYEHGLMILSRLRAEQISSEIYPESLKLKKQFTYADKKNIPYVLVIGSEELKRGVYSVKDMSSGEQQQVDLDQLIQFLT